MDLKIPYKDSFLDMSLFHKVDCTRNFMMVYVAGAFVKLGFSGFFDHRCLLRSAKILWKLIIHFSTFLYKQRFFRLNLSVT